MPVSSVKRASSASQPGKNAKAPVIAMVTDVPARGPVPSVRAFGRTSGRSMP